jgi:hypothetical protein
MKSYKVTDKDGNVFVMTPVDTEARQAIDEAKNLEFDEDYFTSDLSQDQTTVNVGLNGVPLGVDTPLQFTQDDPTGIVLGLDTATLKASLTGAVADGNTGFPTGDAVYEAIATPKVAATGTTSSTTYTVLIELDKYNVITIPDEATDLVVEVPNPDSASTLRKAFFEFTAPENGTLNTVTVISDPSIVTGQADFVVKGRTEYFHDVRYLGTIYDELVSIDRYVQPIGSVGTSGGDEIVTSGGDEVVVGATSDYIVTDTIDKRISELDSTNTVAADDHLVMDSTTLGYRTITIDDLFDSAQNTVILEFSGTNYPDAVHVSILVSSGKNVILRKTSSSIGGLTDQRYYLHLWVATRHEQRMEFYPVDGNSDFIQAYKDLSVADPVWVWSKEDNAGIVQPEAITQTFSTGNTYSAGDTVMYKGLRYTAVSNQSAGQWDPNGWRETSVEDTIGDIETLLAAL